MTNYQKPGRLVRHCRGPRPVSASSPASRATISPFILEIRCRETIEETVAGGTAALMSRSDSPGTRYRHIRHNYHEIWTRAGSDNPPGKRLQTEVIIRQTIIMIEVNWRKGKEGDDKSLHV